MSIAINRNFAVDLNSKKAKTPAFKAELVISEPARSILMKQYHTEVNKLELNKDNPISSYKIKPVFDNFCAVLEKKVEEDTKGIKGTIYLGSNSKISS